MNIFPGLPLGLGSLSWGAMCGQTTPPQGPSRLRGQNPPPLLGGSLPKGRVVREGCPEAEALSAGWLRGARGVERALAGAQ